MPRRCVRRTLTRMAARYHTSPSLRPRKPTKFWKEWLTASYPLAKCAAAGVWCGAALRRRFARSVWERENNLMAFDILEPGAPLPVSLGSCADLLHDVRTLRLSMQKEVDVIEAREKEIRDHLIASFDIT